jgi:putative ABC transport system ATP-binding protein
LPNGPAHPGPIAPSSVKTTEQDCNPLLFAQGDPGDLVYLVKEGEVEIEIVRVRDDRNEELLARIGPGRYFVEPAPMFGIRRSATARATQPVVRRRHSRWAISAPLPR